MHDLATDLMDYIRARRPNSGSQTKPNSGSQTTYTIAGLLTIADVPHVELAERGGGDILGYFTVERWRPSDAKWASTPWKDLIHARKGRTQLVHLRQTRQSPVPVVGTPLADLVDRHTQWHQERESANAASTPSIEFGRRRPWRWAWTSFAR